MASNHFEPSPDALASPTDSPRTSSSENVAIGSKKSQLQVEFQPSDYSVVCGRGKDSFNHVGNRRFRILASMFIDRYSQADNKTAKSAIVSEIIDVIRKAGGIFCKYKKGAWFKVRDHTAREKVSSLMRDLLHTQYRSSAKAKIGRRQKSVKQEQGQKLQSDQKRVEGTEDSDDSSSSAKAKIGRRTTTRKTVKQEHNQNPVSGQKRVERTEDSDDSSTTSSCWGRSKDSLGFEYWLEDSDDFFDIDVF
jgi:hypothetical protein